MQALKALVIALGMLIVIAATVVAVTLYQRASQPAADGSRAPAAFGTQRIEVPKGATVERTEAAAGRLLVTLRLADGSARVLVIDPGTGTLTGTLELAPQP